MDTENLKGLFNASDYTALTLAVAAYMARTQWLIKARELEAEHDETPKEYVAQVEALPPGWWIWMVDSIVTQLRDIKKTTTFSDGGNAMVDVVDDMCVQYFTDEKERLKMHMEYTLSDAYDSQAKLDQKNKGNDNDE